MTFFREENPLESSGVRAGADSTPASGTMRQGLCTLTDNSLDPELARIARIRARITRILRLKFDLKAGQNSV